MSNLIYVKEPLLFEAEDSFIVTLNERINSENELMQWYYNNLKFPSYFGFNWDALTDCLRYLDGSDKYRVIIIHNTIPELNFRELRIYILIMNSAVEFLNQHPEDHKLVVVFPEKYRFLTEGILENFPKK